MSLTKVPPERQKILGLVKGKLPPDQERMLVFAISCKVFSLNHMIVAQIYELQENHLHL